VRWGSEACRHCRRRKALAVAVSLLQCCNRLPGLAAIIGAIARHEVDVVVVQSLHHLGTSVDDLLETLAELYRHGVKPVVHDHADAVETGGLLAAADLLVEARRAYRRGNIVSGQLRARASGVRFGRPPVPSSRLEKVRMALREGQGVRQAARSSGVSPAKASRIKAEMVGVRNASATPLRHELLPTGDAGSGSQARAVPRWAYRLGKLQAALIHWPVQR
jgi:DNA invertase Pin-like site-specific DNA recombinase